MATTPFLMRFTDFLERREVRSGDDLDGPEKSPETSAIVVGYGRFGQTVAQMLMAKGIGVTLIDKKPSMIETAEEFGTKVYYGDGLRLDLLRTAGAETAQVIAFCNDNEGGELSPRRAEGGARSLSPGGGDGARLSTGVHLIELDGLDLAFAEREMFESAVVMGRAALQGERHRAATRSSGSSANIACATASGSSGRARPAIFTPAGNRRSAPTGRCRTRKSRGRPRRSPPARCFSSAANDRVDHVAVRAVAAFHMDMGLGVGRPRAPSASRSSVSFRIAVAEQRPGVAARRCARRGCRPARRARR